MHRGSIAMIRTLLAAAVLLSAPSAAAENGEAADGLVAGPSAVDLAALVVPFPSAAPSTYSPRVVGGPVADPLYPTLIGAGSALLATGLLIAALSVRDANDLCAQAQAGAIPCPCPAGEPTEQQLPYKQVYDNARIGIGVGIGIAAIGGIALAITIPVAIHHGKVRQISLMATLNPPTEASGPPRGVQMTLIVR